MKGSANSIVVVVDSLVVIVVFVVVVVGVVKFLVVIVDSDAVAVVVLVVLLLLLNVKWVKVGISTTIVLSMFLCQQVVTPRTRPGTIIVARMIAIPGALCSSRKL